MAVVRSALIVLVVPVSGYGGFTASAPPTISLRSITRVPSRRAWPECKRAEKDQLNAEREPKWKASRGPRP